MRLVALQDPSLVTKITHQMLLLLHKTGTMHMQQCQKNDKDDFG